MVTDETGCMPNWLKWLIGGAIIIGLGVATALTGGTIGVILGAAFYGAVTSAVSGALLGAAIGVLTGGMQGLLDGMADGFMSGAISGAIMGALLSGANALLGGVKISGSAQKGVNYIRKDGTIVKGTFFHRMASNIEGGKMAVQISRYSEIALNRSLNSVKLVGTKRPDVIGVARWGKSLIVEVTSKSQTVMQMNNKINLILLNNPDCVGKVVNWAAKIGRYLI